MSVRFGCTVVVSPIWQIEDMSGLWSTVWLYFMVYANARLTWHPYRKFQNGRCRKLFQGLLKVPYLLSEQTVKISGPLVYFNSSFPHSQGGIKGLLCLSPSSFVFGFPSCDFSSYMKFYFLFFYWCISFSTV